ncbi:MAG: DUF2075 domain-containing protein [Levilactobacillus sp.]|jgi:DUF2075 family protein/predicted GIY-YIG superfamily endonuclease|uniref:DUF2075 domain-containing protein n=1 Tax=Levilactobacillus sp. TaxID=2767919 RepID=UPI00258606E7|nr:DUF2075 domain-containing protein [Levilactobacillus sp.]MCI1552943.1 DUF2075 domain-containing protein [Levilactobacillus sp.]MCI1598083.1 DUF2075 domain-containing protein [Levilactobacillus sp.]MCI1606083.1 DUF2075 domain-containing protein [Levilactobacillus sp.]
MAKVERPEVQKVDFDGQVSTEIKKKVSGQRVELLLEYPTVYIVYDKQKAHDYQVYVGETNDIVQRTWQHLEIDPATRQDWKYLAESPNSQLVVIGHPHFNKSLTMDIENSMMLYMSGVPSVKRLNNRRENQQNKYYTANEKNAIFSVIWRKLHDYDADLFPIEAIVRDSALFKASPFHSLTREQDHAREKILRKIQAAFKATQGHQLILVEGEAGSGKTVLLSSLFYQLWQLGQDQNYTAYHAAQNYLLVNHDEQVKVYQNIAEKLGIPVTHVSKPTTFINDPKNTQVDVVLVDEAHLLWTQGKQSYRGKNQWDDILSRAKVVVAVFDKRQILSREGYISADQVQQLERRADQQGGLITLKHQLRMNANQATQDWLIHFVQDGVVGPVPADENYDLQVFTDPVAMYDAIRTKAQDQTHGLSRMLATFDWPYSSTNKQIDYVTVGKLKLPWNKQLKAPKGQPRWTKHLAWAEQEQTLGEVGSTFTIQGFDLNYSGVIIGPSVKYRDGHVVFDPSASQNSKVTKKRTVQDANGQQQKISVADQLLPHELNVLLTRGVNGLYIYAVDEALQAALLAAQAQR